MAYNSNNNNNNGDNYRARYNNSSNNNQSRPYSAPRYNNANNNRAYDVKNGYNRAGNNQYQYSGRGYGMSPKNNMFKIVLISLMIVVLLTGAIIGAFFFLNTNNNPTVPTGLTNLSNNIVSWDKSKNASNYTVRLDGNKVDEIKFSTSVTSQDLNTTELDRTYWVDVNAKSNSGKESEYSEGIYFTREAREGTIQLGKPQNVIADPMTRRLTWESVPNAAGYKVDIQGNKYNLSSIETEYDLSRFVGSFLIGVVALGDGINYDNSASAQVSYEYKENASSQLSTPSNVSINGSMLSWTGVTNAQFYRVYLDGNLYRDSDSSTNFSLSSIVSVGTYRLSVQACTNNDSFYDSYISSEVIYEVKATEKEKLETPTITINTTSKLVSWNTINNASGYVVNIDGSDNNVGSSTSYQLENLSGGTHTIKVKAKGDDINYSDSDYSPSQDYIVDAGTEKLATPVIKIWNDEQKGNHFVSWDQIKNASGYTIDINGTMYHVNSNNVAFDLKFLSSGTYNIKVKAQGNSNWADSDFSEPKQYVQEDTANKPSLEQLSKPTIRINGTNVEWNNDENAFGYNVKISKLGGGSQVLPVGKGITFYPLTEFKNGTYEISVQARGDDVVYSDSEYSSIANYEHSDPNATPVATPSGLRIEMMSGVSRFEWNQTTGADGGYNVDVNGTITHVWTTYLSLDGAEPGDLTLRVQALPQDNSDTNIPSEWAVLNWYNTTPKLETPTIFLDQEAKILSWNDISGASEYEIEINGIPYETKAPNVVFDLSVLTSIKVYNIKVKAKDSSDTHYSSSNWSNEVVYAPDIVMIDTPVAYVSDKKLNWYLVDNATGYEIDIDGTIYRVGDTVTQFDVSDLTEPRTYRIRVMALGNGEQYLNSAWSSDVNYLVTNKAPIDDADIAVANFEKYFPKNDYDQMFAHRLGTRAWKDDAEAQAYYKDDYDRENRTDFYSYDNLVKAIRTLATKQLEIYNKEGENYGGKARLTVIDKTTDQRIVINNGAEGLDDINAPEIIQIVDFGDFMNSDNENDNKRELAAFLANISHETNGGYRGVNTPEDRFTYGLFWNEELDFIGATSSYYQNADKTYEAVPGHSYHGRGPIQITWQYNYGAFSNIVFLDKNVLLNKPELVAQDGSLGFMAALWFWMQPDYPKDSCHNIMMGNYVPDRSQDMQFMVEIDGVMTTNNFALTIMVINGGFEGGKAEGESTSVDDRVGYYRTYAAIIGADISKEKLFTDGFTTWQ